MSWLHFQEMPRMQKVYTVKKASVHSSAARDEEQPLSTRQTGYRSLANRPQTSCEPDFVFPESVYIPGHAWHEKGLRSQEGVGPQFSSQERRAAVPPRINRLPTASRPLTNRLPTARQPVIVFPENGSHRNQDVRVVWVVAVVAHLVDILALKEVMTHILIDGQTDCLI